MDIFSEKVIYIRSTDVDRTLMSAESNLAGLFPPKGSQIWNKDISWQPIPVHTVPITQDNLLSSHAICPRMTQLIEEVMASPTFEKINQDNAWLYEYVSNNTGANVTNVIQIDYIFDTLLVETFHNMKLPNWTHAVFPDKMKGLRDLSFKITTW